MRNLKMTSAAILTAGILTLFAACNMNAPHEHTYSEAWTADETYHWHAATCEHTDEVSDKAEHTFGEWTVTTAATENAKGSREKSCSVCGYKVTEVIAKLEHKHEVGTKHEAVAGTCVKKATIEYYDCKNSNCKAKLDKDGKELTSVEGTIDAANHTGTATTWTKTATTHKETYDCCKAVKTAEADHTFGEWKSNNDATTKADGTKTRTCSVCSYAETVTDAGTKIEIVATPAFSIATGAVDSGTTVAITCATTGAKIYYTKDGTEPTTTSTEYTSAISITANVTIKAIAVKNGMGDSAVASAFYALKIPDFPFIPTGTFQMGSNQGYDQNKTVHNVTLTKAFYMCDHEVTQKEYKTVMGINPSECVEGNEDKKVADGEVQENRPVEQVNWYMTLVYCNKRSIKEGLTPCYKINGKTDPAEWGDIPTSYSTTWSSVECYWNANGYRLPTEAEWEYAARAGNSTVDSLIYSGTDAETSLGNYAWTESNSGNKTHEVKKAPGGANAFGLYDMSGNVWEWCWDCWKGDDGYAADAVTDPRGASNYPWQHVVRGGAYYSYANDCAVSLRSYDETSSDGYGSTGFRVVRTAN